MAVNKKSAGNKRKVEAYQHKGKERLNNPPAGLVTPETDPPTPAKKTYQYDPHLDPQLVWAGKAEHTSFKVPTVSLHVHERIEPRTIIEAVRRKNGNGRGQLPLFASPVENPPLREAIEFYKHRHNWSNRLIAGDSLLVMNSLLEKGGNGRAGSDGLYRPTVRGTLSVKFSAFRQQTRCQLGRQR
jgi:adenine-specific DNA-methyltransferase